MYRLFTNSESQNLLDVIFRLEMCSDSDEFSSIISSCHSLFYFDMNNILYINPVQNFTLYNYLNCYSKEFYDHYEEQEYYLHDPVWNGFVASDNIFYWGDVASDFDKDDITKKIMYEAESVGVVDGCSYSKDIGKNRMIINFITDKMIKGGDIYRTKVLTRTLGPHITRVVTKCLDEDLRKQNKLSERQFETLKYLTKGLGRNDISKKMKISSKSVDAHLDEAKKKLGAGNRNELLLKAKDLFVFE